jgi:hypothetical protein
MGTSLTTRLELCLIAARTGRTVASLGAYLTSKEQEEIPEIYSRLSNGEVVDEESPATAFITSKAGKKGKISQSEAVNWFIGQYPKWSLPLQKKLKEEKTPRTRKILAYGLREGRDFSDDYYIQVLEEVANLPGAQARNFYEYVIRPQLAKMEELSGLITTEMKLEKKP